MSAFPTEQILGIPFFNGGAEQAISHVIAHGGLVVAPSGTCFDRFLRDGTYREAILHADLVLPDSGFMVVLWRLLHARKVRRVSGLAYLQALLHQDRFRRASLLWVLPNERARDRLLAWARDANVSIAEEDTYVAPLYGTAAIDLKLLGRIRKRTPAHVIIGIGAGAQEKLGHFLREEAGGTLGIHCIGGALGFVTGDQVAIPGWADRFFLGWLLRFLAQPRVFIPRLWQARVLPGLVLRYRERLPPLRPGVQNR